MRGTTLRRQQRWRRRWCCCFITISYSMYQLDEPGPELDRKNLWLPLYWMTIMWVGDKNSTFTSEPWLWRGHCYRFVALTRTYDYPGLNANNHADEEDVRDITASHSRTCTWYSTKLKEAILQLEKFWNFVGTARKKIAKGKVHRKNTQSESLICATRELYSFASKGYSDVKYKIWSEIFFCKVQN